MASISDLLFSAAQQQGLNVVAKTQFGPEIQVYDSNAPAAPPSPFAKLIGPVGVQLRDSTGRVLYSAGSWPTTNPAAVLTVIAAFGVLGFAVYKAIKNNF